MATKANRTLVIVAHPDDEALSCGGLILNRLKSWSKVKVLVMCGRRYPEFDNDLSKIYVMAERQRQDLAASINVLRRTDNGLYAPLDYSYHEFVEGEPYSTGFYPWLEVIENALKEGWDEVVIPGMTDLNQDHVHLGKCCRIALRPANLGSVKRVLQWHAHDGGTPAGANWFEPLSFDQLDQKESAIACYVDEAREVPHPRALSNIVAHAEVCGSIAGHIFAEPYTLYLQR